MSLDKLLIIFIIIILPIAFILNTYVNLQADTLNMQTLYDAKLLNATNDALKAFQSNSFNEGYEDLTEARMANVEASGNVFLNSIANNFSMQGFSNETLQSYIPAVVFTMYDGYYIYSKFENSLPDDINILSESYKNGDIQYGVKPYIYYSCRYKQYYNGNLNDFVITYSMDNYIHIQGQIDGNWVNEGGYVIDTSKVTNDTGRSIKYRNKTIEKESMLMEYVGTTLYEYRKINGTKYYLDRNYIDSNGIRTNRWFTIDNNSKKNYTMTSYSEEDDSAYNYYRDAKAFTNKLINTYHFGTLKPSNAVVADNTSGNADNNETFYEYNFYSTNSGDKIFAGTDTNRFPTETPIEEIGSNFNEHRLAVIRYTIEKNLSIAIANYNTFSGGSTTNFQMPVLKDTEWDKILNNIGIISFMQGLPMGSKTYNGCAVVSNNKNADVVTENSIYIVNMPHRWFVNSQGTSGSGTSTLLYYYDVKKKDLDSEFPSPVEISNKKPVGILNTDLERRYWYNEDSTDVRGDYYYPKLYYADYTSIITKTENVNISANETDSSGYKYNYNGNIYKYLDLSQNDNISIAFYTALARERYSAYKSTR